MKKLFLLIVLVSTISFSFARGGGGGSGDFSSFGGFSSSYGMGSFGGSFGADSLYSSHYRKNYTNVPSTGNTYIDFLFFSLCVIALIFAKKPFNVTSGEIALKTSEWSEQDLKDRATLVFYAFQKAWSENDLNTLKLYVSDHFYDQLSMEMFVLSNQKRENKMYNIELKEVIFKDTYDDADDTKDCFRAFITASAKDVLYDTEHNVELYTDSSSFSEMWTFLRTDGLWKLDAINQASDEIDSNSLGFFTFANIHSFYYNPDFGSLMIPNRGVLFSDIDFGKVDINNHVIGRYKDKIVEFYSTVFNDNDEYLVCQAILPTEYGDILVRKKNSPYRVSSALNALRKIEMESNTFNDVFDVYFSKSEGNPTFELLNPLFMAYIMQLPFDISIEIVGNTLYIYTKGVVDASYEKMLDILSRSFDEMKS